MKLAGTGTGAEAEIEAEIAAGFMMESMVRYFSNWLTCNIVDIAVTYQHLVANTEALRQGFNNVHRAMLAASATHRDHQTGTIIARK